MDRVASRPLGRSARRRPSRSGRLLDGKADKKDAEAAALALSARPDVASVNPLVSPEDSADQSRALVGAALPPLGDVLGWSADVRLQKNGSSDTVEAAARALPHVDEVDGEAPLETRAKAISGAAEVLASVLALFVLAAAVFVVSTYHAVFGAPRPA